MANVLLITTPGCHKALVGLFAAFAPREVVQRAVRPCSVSLRGAGLVSIDVCDPMPGLPVRQLRLIVIFHLRRILSENTLVRTVPAVVDVFRSGLVHSITVFVKICPCLCFRAVLCHLVVVFLPIFAPHVLSCHSSTVPSSGVTSSLVPSLSTFSAKMLEHRAALLVDNKDASPSVCPQPFCMRFSRVLPD